VAVVAAQAQQIPQADRVPEVLVLVVAAAEPQLL
jgi:hypothetical protein